MVSKKDLVKITKLQSARQKEFRETGPNGKMVEYLGKKFVVFKNVFWAFYDNPLLPNFTVNAGDTVLDVGTGTGVIAIFAAYKGAGKVIAVDLNPAAVACAKENVRRHGFGKIIEVRLSNVFSAIKPTEKFNVIAANLPFRIKPAKDLVEASMWDTGFRVHKAFFKGVSKHLKPNGRIFLDQANYGGLREMKALARKHGFSIKIIGKNTFPKSDPRYPAIFYGFELKRTTGKLLSLGF